MLELAWKSDQDLVYLEVNNNQDSEVSTIYDLLIDMEKSGIVDAKLCGHNCSRPSGPVDSETPDSFTIEPKPGSNLWFKYNDIKSIKYTNAASVFPSTVLRASKLLAEVWRVQFVKEDKEISPKKPLWFLKKELVLEKGACIRVL